MNIRTDEGVTEALQEVASWYSQKQTSESNEIYSLDVDSRPATASPGFRPRFALVAVVLLAAFGAGGLVLSRWASEATPAGLGASIDRQAFIDLCLDIDSGYDLDELAATGTLHLFGDPNSGSAPLIISSGSLHVACGLVQRDDGEWFQVVSTVDTHLPLATSDDVNVLVAMQLNDRTYIGGQVGSDIDIIDVERLDGEYGAQILGGWWGVSFDALDDLNQSFPPFSLRWKTTTGDTETAQGFDLLNPEPWNLCAQDTNCRDNRLLELQELAKASESTGQAEILADGIVTQEENRSALRNWGECIAQSTGANVTFDDNGLFTIHDSGDHISAAFEKCKESHITLVAEAQGLAVAANS